MYIEDYSIYLYISIHFGVNLHLHTFISKGNKKFINFQIQLLELQKARKRNYGIYEDDTISSKPLARWRHYRKRMHRIVYGHTTNCQNFSRTRVLFRPRVEAIVFDRRVD